MRICIVAENASFRFGGEAAIPLHYFSGLRAAGEDVWLVVHERNREELQALFPEDMHRIRFASETWMHKALVNWSTRLPRRFAESTLGVVGHLLTQFLQRKLLRELVARESIDLIHQPTPVSPRSPSVISGFGVPVVMGPMNGSMEYPAWFRTTRSRLSRAGINCVRQFTNLINSILHGKREARILLVANERTRHALPSPVKGKIIQMHENGVDFATWSLPPGAGVTARIASPRGRFVFVGRLIDWKGVDVAIEAIARVQGAELEIIGDGPMRRQWTTLAESLGIAGRVNFRGWLTQSECSVRLRYATALVLPSLYECGGAVLLEAMAVGVPGIATNWGGPADYVREDCGILVDPSSRSALISGFADAMRRFISEPELSAKMGAAGRAHAEMHFNWKHKIGRIRNIYKQALAGAPGRQDDQSTTEEVYRSQLIPVLITSRPSHKKDSGGPE